MVLRSQAGEAWDFLRQPAGGGSPAGGHTSIMDRTSFGTVGRKKAL